MNILGLSNYHEEKLLRTHFVELNTIVIITQNYSATLAIWSTQRVLDGPDLDNLAILE